MDDLPFFGVGGVGGEVMGVGLEGAGDGGGVFAADDGGEFGVVEVRAVGFSGGEILAAGGAVDVGSSGFTQGGGGDAVDECHDGGDALGGVGAARAEADGEFFDDGGGGDVGEMGHGMDGSYGMDGSGGGGRGTSAAAGTGEVVAFAELVTAGGAEFGDAAVFGIGFAGGFVEAGELGGFEGRDLFDAAGDDGFAKAIIFRLGVIDGEDGDDVTDAEYAALGFGAGFGAHAADEVASF